jgi:hypothetical protein
VSTKSGQFHVPNYEAYAYVIVSLLDESGAAELVGHLAALRVHLSLARRPTEVHARLGARFHVLDPILQSFQLIALKALQPADDVDLHFAGKLKRRPHVRDAHLHGAR